MIRVVLALSALCGSVQSSVEHGVGAVPVFQAPAAAVPLPPPVVTSASSQYFERTFNRLVVSPVFEPVVPVAPPQAVFPVAPAPSVIPVASPPPVLVQPTVNSLPVPPNNQPIQPNVAIAIATAQAAPVATILLPPYPFGQPATIGFIPPTPPINVPDESRKESTTQRTTKVDVKTTTKQVETTTSLPVPSNSDNSFAQALPSNEDVSFKLYGPPQSQWPRQRPQKLKTSVEIVPVPLAYIMPPPLPTFQAIKSVKHFHTFVPRKEKIIIRPLHRHVVSAPIKIRTVRVPSRLVYRAPLIARIDGPGNRPETREIEPTTFRPSFRQSTKPPKI